ncbi:MAG TPA: ABC transporter substrate-binding protein, partial [Candidatus Acidoferrum sp.]|nr:ABC transporter substrate-binding protein [Candidatus Acidoferrum sp.]
MKQPRMRGAMGVMALAVTLALTAAPALAQQTIKVGAVFSLTGKLALLGLPSANAVKLAVKEINDAGGITVRNEKVKIDLLLKDDRGIPAEAVAAAVELITKNNVKFIFGPIGSVVGMPVVEITRKERVMQFTPLTQVGPLMGKPGYEYLFQTYNWEFGPQGRVNTYAPFIAKIARQEGVKSVAFLDSTDDYSQAILDAYVPKVKELGLNVLAVERYDRAGTTDFYPQLNKLKGLKPDALIWGYTDESGKLIIRQALEVGLTKKFFTSQG